MSMNPLPFKKNYRISEHLSNLVGFRTSRKLIIIESDDWGSIRMPSLANYKFLFENGVPVNGGDSARYNTNDTVESAEDLTALYEVLSGYKDANGRHPIFTALALAANPDFDKIRESGFNQYQYETLPQTYNRYGRGDMLPIWKQGMDRGLIVPEFHGREHLNVASWMRHLKNGDKNTMLGFENGCWGFRNTKPGSVSFQAAFDLENPEDIEPQREILADGLSLFKEVFGRKARLFVPPNGPINNSLQEVAHQNGIEFISTSKIQYEVFGHGKVKKHLHYPGQKNKYGQVYLTRNVYFEPNQAPDTCITNCLRLVNLAFKWKKPAVISTHRVNYIGGLNIENRRVGLSKLNELIATILKIWPDVEFISTSELGDLMKK